MVGRMKMLGWIFLLFILLLAGRLYYIQIICGEALADGASAQQLIPVVEENSRGSIFDRNMKKLTDTTCAYYYLIVKERCDKECEKLLQILDCEVVGYRGEDYLVYATRQFLPSVHYVLKNKYDAYGFCYGTRYGEDQTAMNLIAALEQMYDEQLSGGEPEYYFLGDGIGGMVTGSGLLQSKSEPAFDSCSLLTTIDSSLQKEIEKLFQEMELEGSAVVSQVETGQIWAMASIESPIDDEDTEAATAIDEASDQREPHNEVMEDIFNVSTLYKMLEATAVTEGRGIVETIQQMGFGSPVFQDFPGEEGGLVTVGVDDVEILATPMQVNRFTCIAAGGGIKRTMSVAMSQAVETGTTASKTVVLQKAASDMLQEKMKMFKGENWITGWVEGENGKFAVTVFLQSDKAHKKTGRENALPVFESIADLLTE